CIKRGQHGSLSGGRELSVALVKSLDDVHARDDLREGGHLAVQGAVVVEMDDHLGRAPVGARLREGHEPLSVALGGGALWIQLARTGPERSRWIVGNVLSEPGPSDVAIAVDTEICHQVGDSIEPVSVVEPVFDQIVETVGAMWSPVAMHLDDELPCAG